MNVFRKFAVIGASGFVGTALCKALGRNSAFDVTPVTRENYAAMQSGIYDVVINAAMPSGRFWAKNNPEADYRETVEKTAAILNNWQCQKIIQISTVSARTEPDSVYGRHKAEAEKLIDLKKHWVVRLSSMYSPTLSKGAVIDILNRSKVFVSGESRYPFASLDFVSNWIVQNIQRQGLTELGAKNSVSLQEIADHLGEKIEFSGPVENQEIQNARPDFPDARGVFTFVDSMRLKKK